MEGGAEFSQIASGPEGPDEDRGLTERLETLAMSGGTRRGRDVLWAAGSRIGTQVLQLLSTLVLARILDPAAFGVVAVANVFAGFANIYSDLGLGAALVRRTALSREILATAFYLNLWTGVGLGFLIAGLGVPLAHLYHMHDLTLIMSVAALQIVLNLTVVPLAVMERAFRFRRVAYIEIFTAVASVAVSVTMAAVGCGPVSLVTGPVVGVVLQGILLWTAARVAPRGRVSRRALKELWAYSGPLMVFNTLIYWARNVDNLVLGVVAGSVALGLYTRAYVLMLVPVGQVTLVLGRVLLPTLSRQRSSIPAMRAVYLRALRLSSAITIPLGVGIATLSVPLVAVLFGPHWHRMSPMLAILASTTPAQVIIVSSGPIYQALGETRMWSRRSGVAAVVTMICLCAGAIWGAIGVCAAFAATTFGLAHYTLSQPWRLIDLPMSRGLAESAPALAGATCMALALGLLDSIAADWNSIVWLVTGLCGGTLVYVVAVSAFDRSLIDDLISALRRE